MVFDISEDTWLDIINNTPEWDPTKLGGTPGKKRPKKNNSSRGFKKKKR